MIQETTQNVTKTSWLDRSIFARFTFNWETALFSLILILAIVSRFYDIGARVMSHDETSHVYFSWLFSRGSGYAHDPVTHGPFQFHVVGLTYFLLGDNDTTARIPAALFSIATVYFAWHYRRYLGRAGALVAALLFTISPYMLYYGRYVRNEAFVALWGLLTIWAILRYIESGKNRYLYWLTIATVLHFTTKETSFIYHAQALLFLGLYFVFRVTRRAWPKAEYRSGFLIALIAALLLGTTGGLLSAYRSANIIPSSLENPSVGAVYPFPSIVPTAFYLTAALVLVAAVFLLISGYTLPQIRKERSFDLVVLLGTLVLPMLTPFVLNWLGWSVPSNAAELSALDLVGVLRMGAVLGSMFLISIGLGLWWNPRKWSINAAIWYVIFIVFYTSLFTHGRGFFTGLLGSLGYWLSQQEVNRGSQPFYYYALLQVPFYEFLPAIGSLLALGLALVRRYTVPIPAGLEEPAQPALPASEPAAIDEGLTLQKELGLQSHRETPPTLALLGFWSITSLLAYSIAGEKMPWLTVHIALPMILTTAWAIGYFIDHTDWSLFRRPQTWASLVLLIVLVPAVVTAIAAPLGNEPPFAGKSLAQLADTASFFISIGATVACVFGVLKLMKGTPARQVRHLSVLVVLAFLGVLTARSAFMASYINYDRATEYLVYAHAGPGPKIALAQIEDISRRLTGGLDLVVAYDNDTTYPYWWYLRNFPNQRYYGSNPTRDLRDAAVILVGDENYGKIEPIVGQAYYRFDYIRLWWPNQDYFNLTWGRVWNTIKDPQMRTALFKIWLNRDYTLYGTLTNQDLSLDNWYPGARMRLYVRKDVVAQLWDYGTTATTETIAADPYEGKGITLTAVQTIGTQGIAPGQFQNPRDIAIAPDGSLYVADTKNHRIQHLSAEGEVLHVWGTYGDNANGLALGGFFYEPWAVAVGPDGSVYVADTWNHRIQHFTAEGEFINMVGYFGTAETLDALWGPRDIAVDEAGNIYVTDTGNKRVVVFDANLLPITGFGTAGFDVGQFDEPVGVAVDSDEMVYVADTWNQRIQVFMPDGAGGYTPFRQWDVVAWYGESLENKPYIAVDSKGNVFLSDPEGYRILRFRSSAEFAYYWGDFGFGLNTFNIPNGLAADSQGNLWVVDSSNHRILRFEYTP